MDDKSLDQLIMQVARSKRFADAWRDFEDQDQHADFCDLFSKRVAGRYLANTLVYLDADRAMNGLYAYAYHLGVDRGMPEYSWAVFITFEEGEYVHDGDNSDTPADEKYVRPLLQKMHA
jgi:hypothetical protein